MILLLLIQLSYAEDFFRCQRHEDCTVVKGCCGWMSVNKSSQNEIELKNKKICPQVECFVKPDFSVIPKVYCSQNKCEIKN